MKRSNLFLTALCLIGFFSTSFAQLTTQALPVSDALAVDGSPHANELFQGLLGGDTALAGTRLSEQFQIFGTGPAPMDKTAYLNMWQGYADANQSMGAALNTLPLTVASGEMAGDWVMVWGEAKWTPKGGQEITSWFHQALKLEGDQFVLGYHFQDELAILMQMGFQVVPPSSEQGDN